MGNNTKNPSGHALSSRFEPDVALRPDVLNERRSLFRHSEQAERPKNLESLPSVNAPMKGGLLNL